MFGEYTYSELTDIYITFPRAYEVHHRHVYIRKLYLVTELQMENYFLASTSVFFTNYNAITSQNIYIMFC
jgi:hypothetical protein